MPKLAKYSAFAFAISVLCSLVVFSGLIERAFASLQGNMQSYLPIVMCDDCAGIVATPLPTSTSNSTVTASATASSTVSVSATATMSPSVLQGQDMAIGHRVHYVLTIRIMKPIFR